MTVPNATPNANPQAGTTPAQTPQQGAPAAQQVPLPELLKEREKRQELQAEVEALKQQMGQLRMQPPAQQQPVYPQQQQVDPRIQQLEKLWEENPRQAIQTEISMAMEWADRVNAEVDHQFAEVAGKYSTDFNHYEGKVRQWIRQLPLSQRNKQGVVELAYHAIKGQGIDDVIKRVQEETIAKMRAGTLGVPSGSLPGGGSQPVVLTDEERRVAEVMGIKEEDYLKHKVVK